MKNFYILLKGKPNFGKQQAIRIINESLKKLKELKKS